MGKRSRIHERCLTLESDVDSMMAYLRLPRAWSSPQGIVANAPGEGVNHMMARELDYSV
jgi:hypothetical protein